MEFNEGEMTEYGGVDAIVGQDGDSGQTQETSLRAEISSCSRSGAPGGPLSVPGFVSGRINVKDFRDSCGALLAAVTAELDDYPSQDDNMDILVDDLKIMTDAMLVEKALAEVLQGQDALPRATGDCGARSHDEQNDGQHDIIKRNSLDATQCDELGDGQPKSQASTSGSGQLRFNFSVPPKTGKKRGRPFDRDTRASLLMDDMDTRRTEALARLKREREDGREKASLHSLRAKRERENLYSQDQRPLRTLKFLTSILKTPKLATREQFEPIKDGEVLLTVEIYDSSKRHLKTQEFTVYGTQPLTTLKDQIYCLTDTIAEKTHLTVPSSYFLIEDTFYNDMRDSKAIDYSLPIRTWVRGQTEALEKWKALGGSDYRKREWLGLPYRQKTTLPPSFQAANMVDVSFLNLECRLGAQFLYCHQGDCKHAVVIRDMRLVHPEDVQNAAAYPVLRYVHKLRHRKCTICCIYQARKVTLGDKLAPDNPCFFCDNCYYLLHYSKEGTLLYSDFQVHDYYHE